MYCGVEEIKTSMYGSETGADTYVETKRQRLKVAGGERVK
jgi:hypothetical protein